jgi:hypothetical protein
MILLYYFTWFLLLQIFVYIFSIYLCIFVCANIFGAIVLKARFKIDVVVVVIWSIVIIINAVLTLQVSTASLPHDREPCEIKVVSNHTCSLHTCVYDGSRRERVRLSGLINGRNQFNSWGFPQVPHSGPGLCRTHRKVRTSTRFCISKMSIWWAPAFALFPSGKGKVYYWRINTYWKIFLNHN